MVRGVVTVGPKKGEEALAREVLERELRAARGKKGDAVENAVVAMAVAVRTLVALLEVLERGEFRDDGPGASESEVRAARIVGRVRSEAERRRDAMRLLRAASFALDVMLPAPAEIVWKLFVRGGARLADGMDRASKCRCVVA